MATSPYHARRPLSRPPVSLPCRAGGARHRLLSGPLPRRRRKLYAGDAARPPSSKPMVDDDDDEARPPAPTPPPPPSAARASPDAASSRQTSLTTSKVELLCATPRAAPEDRLDRYPCVCFHE